MILGAEFLFDAAHKIENHKGKCRNLHGHTYKLVVSIDGQVGDDGMVMDFTDVKSIVKEKVISILDHSYLNDIIPCSTAENLAVFIWKKLENEIPLYEIKLWENTTSWVSLGREDIK